MTTPVKTTALIRKESAVVATALVKNPVTAMLQPDVPVGQMILGFDPTDPAMSANVFKCDDKGTRDKSQHTTEPFMLVTWGAVKTRKTEEGEDADREFVRLTLIDNEGETMTFSGDYAHPSFDLFRAMKGDGPYDPPQPVIAKHITTDSGHLYKIRPWEGNGKPAKSK